MAEGEELDKNETATPLNEQGMTIAGYMAGLSRPTVH